jgi:hypothetical protein
MPGKLTPGDLGVKSGNDRRRLHTADRWCLSHSGERLFEGSYVNLEALTLRAQYT